MQEEAEACLQTVSYTHLDWQKIYQANAETIEQEARKRGKKSSDNGRWIYPGTVLVLP